MQALARAARGILPATAAAPAARVQQARGIVVHVKDGNLERALGVMARKMRSSGIERLIRARSQIHHHVKDSEKRVLARKALMQRVRSQELGKKLRDILIKKIRSAPPPPPCHTTSILLLRHSCALVGASCCVIELSLSLAGVSAFVHARQVFDEMAGRFYASLSYIRRLL